MKARTEPDIILMNFLRKNLVDINTSRSGNWIFPDFPRIKDLGNTSFPRIGITVISEDETPLGMTDNLQYGSITFQIDVVSKKDQSYTMTVNGETVGTVTSGVNSDRLTLEFLPKTTSTVTVKHNGSSYGTVNAISKDSDFTTLTAGIIEYGSNTGNLNFSSTDITNHNGQSITADYTYVLSGKSACQYLARKIKKSVTQNWRSDPSFHGLIFPVFIGNSSVPIDEDLGLYRQVVELKCNGVELGRGI